MKQSFLLSFEPNGAGGFTVRDGRGRRYDVVNEDSLWRLVQSLNNDPAMPRVQLDKQNEAIGIVARVFRRFVPKHAPLVDALEPVAHQASAIVPVIQKIREDRRERGGE
ncbi:MAG: hypothetical protein K0U16_07250 [Gammaproteobacteria bacterium]|nr:hypothetical protein [Gammaproteobacteria bacterium]